MVLPTNVQVLQQTKQDWPRCLLATGKVQEEAMASVFYQQRPVVAQGQPTPGPLQARHGSKHGGSESRQRLREQQAYNSQTQ